MNGVESLLRDHGLLRDLAVEYEQLKATGRKIDYREWVRERLHGQFGGAMRSCRPGDTSTTWTNGLPENSGA